MRATFEQLCLTQDIHEAQLVEIVESDCCFFFLRVDTSENVHRLPGGDAIPAVQSILPDQGSNRGNGTDFGPQ